MKLKIGYLVSYDYYLIMTSLKQVYEYADNIFLAIDKNRKTWSGNTFTIEEIFFSDIEKFDKKKKIKFYYDEFFLPDLTPAECDTRERNLLLKEMGFGWKVQLDVDEYIYDFGIVSDFLRKYWYLTIFPKLTPIVFKGEWVALIRQLPNGFLYINDGGRFPFITNQSRYELMRENNSVPNHFLGVRAIHQSWARAENEIKTKINNWSHRDDFNKEEYFQFWKNLSSENYKFHKNIHPIYPEVWSDISFIPAQSLNEFINKYSSGNPQKISEFNAAPLIIAIIKKTYRKIRKRFNFDRSQE